MITGRGAVAPVHLAARSSDRPTALDDPRRQHRWRRRRRLAAFTAGVWVKRWAWPSLDVRPRVAELFLTDNCNLRCVSCACWRTTTDGELSTDEWVGVIDQLARAGVEKLNFTGGEALLRSDLGALVRHARARGIGDLHVNTNGILLTTRVVHELLRAGVRSFNVSIDGPDAHVHDGVRGRPGAFDRTVGHLRYLLTFRDELGLRVRMNTTVLASNVDHLPGAQRLADSLGVPLYLNLGTDRTFLFHHPDVAPEVDVASEAVRRAVDSLRVAQSASAWPHPPSELDYIVRFFERGASRAGAEPPCAESLLKVLVRSTGEVGGCWGEEMEANVRDVPIAEVLRSPEYRRLHAQWFRKECVHCGSNYALNLRLDPVSRSRDALARRRSGAAHGAAGR